MSTKKAYMLVQGHNSAFKFNHSVDDNKPLQGKIATSKGVKYEALPEKSPDYSDNRHKFLNGKEAVVLKSDVNQLSSKSKLPENGLKLPSSYDEVNLKRVSHGNPLPGREELSHKKTDKGYCMEGSIPKQIGRSSQDERVKEFEGGSNLRDTLGNATRVRESQDTATARKSPSHVGLFSRNSVNEPLAFNHAGLPDDRFERKVQKDETPRVKPGYSNALPPPYLKPNSKLKSSSHGTDLMTSHIDSNGITKYPSIHQKPDVASKPERIQSGLDNSEQDLLGHARPGKEGHEKELSNHEDAKEVPVFKPKSVRRKHSKSRSTHSDAGNEEAEVVRKSRSRRRDERRGLQILFDDERHKTDEEERIIDRLLIHYSKKPTASVPEKARRKSRSRHTHQKSGRGDEPDETPDLISQTPRSVSLPHEQTEAVEVNKVFARAASLQPDRSNEARHVHPKLPDCDDLAARIAALRGS